MTGTQQRTVLITGSTSGIGAALCPPVDTVALTDEDLEATLAVDVRAPHVLTAALAPAMVERGRVVAVSPGATSTPINASDGDVLTRMTAGIPAGRPGTPEEVADAVVWSLSDRARYVHGAEIAVDGGITATRVA